MIDGALSSGPATTLQPLLFGSEAVDWHTETPAIPARTVYKFGFIFLKASYMNKRKEPKCYFVPLWVYLFVFGIALVAAILVFLFMSHPDVARFTSSGSVLFEAPHPSPFASLT
ncbi:hypothetical protein [Phyllobacterium sp. SB3]|uniref:hypothetical protein n=1 Tax=Phyllobacterium sp. SB3 TaxID=3156073 RepID=UPI0032AEB0AC